MTSSSDENAPREYETNDQSRKKRSGKGTGEEKDKEERRKAKEEKKRKKELKKQKKETRKEGQKDEDEAEEEKGRTASNKRSILLEDEDLRLFEEYKKSTTAKTSNGKQTATSNSGPAKTRVRLFRFAQADNEGNANTSDSQLFDI